MAVTVLTVRTGTTFRITKLSLETVEFDGIRETMPVETIVKEITGPATVRIVEFDKAPTCKACNLPLLDGSHFCHQCGVQQ